MNIEDYSASNPPDIQIQFGQFLRREGVSLVVALILLLVIFAPLGLFVWKWLWLGMLLWPLWFVLSYYGTVRLMTQGNVCAGRVIGTDPGLVAVYTDMSMRPDASYPAIAVKTVSLGGLSGGAVEVGERLAVSCFYQGEEGNENHWTDISTLDPIRGATSSQSDIARTMKSIDKEDWQHLRDGLRSIGKQTEEGIHFLDEGRKEGGRGVTEGRVFLVSADDEGMKAVGNFAQQTFRFFIREWSWENRRIVPGLDFAAVKVAFSDPPEIKTNDPTELDVEYMWVSEVEFDGRRLHGTLLNQPDSLKSVAEGDTVTVSPKKIVDWAYCVMGEVCGGFTIEKMRLVMNRKELRAHDDAWGMDFGTPGGIRLVPDSYLSDEVLEKRTPIPDIEGMFIHGSFKRINAMEHPMSINMREPFEEQVESDTSLLDGTDENGFTMLHSLAMAGSWDGVDVCLENGCDPNQEADNGFTPLKLAKQLGWKRVVARLQEAGAR